MHRRFVWGLTGLVSLRRAEQQNVGVLDAARARRQQVMQSAWPATATDPLRPGDVGRPFCSQFVS